MGVIRTISVKGAFVVLEMHLSIPHVKKHNGRKTTHAMTAHLINDTI